MLDEPVSPKLSRNLALGLLAGLILGSGGALVADRRSGRIFNLEEFQSLVQAPRLATLPKNPDEWPAIMQLLADVKLGQAISLALIPVGNSHVNCEAIAQHLQPYLDHSITITISADWHQIRTCQIQWLVAASGSSTRRELESLQQQLKLHTKTVDGLVWLEG